MAEPRGIKQMTLIEQRYAYQCITRAHFIWFDSVGIDDYTEKIWGLLSALHTLAPYRCCEYVLNLWAAYQHAKDERLHKLAMYRLEIFSEGLKNLKALADKFPDS